MFITGCTYHYLENDKNEKRPVRVVHNYTDTLSYLNNFFQELENKGDIENVNFQKKDTLYEWNFDVREKKILPVDDIRSGVFLFKPKPGSFLYFINPGRQDTVLAITEWWPTTKPARKSFFLLPFVIQKHYFTL